LVSAFQQCDLFSLANRKVNGDLEGFGIVLLEAQSCGKPVITGNSGGTPEACYAPESALIVDCTNVTLLAASMRELLLDRPRQARMGEAGRRWVVEHLDWTVLCPGARAIFAAVGGRQTAVCSETVHC
jgi:phosphatidylinositol alpha-1,6-mannosyltransferase